MNTEIIAKEYGIEEKKAMELSKGLNPILQERESLIQEFKKVSTLEVNEENIPLFRELRLRVQKNRTQGINKWHKASKEFFLAGGRFVDAIKNKENQVNEEMESKLMDAEKYFENLEKERVEKLNQERIKLIEPYVDDVFGLDLGNMQDDVFEAYFESKKKQHAEKIEAEKKAEAERLENERLDKLETDRNLELAPYSQFFSHSYNLRSMTESEYSNLKKQLVKAKKEYEAEQKKIRLENERLKKEREAAEKKRLAEEKKRKADEAKKQAEYEAKLKKEREAREKLEREQKAIKEAEEKRLAEEKRKQLEAKKEAERLAKAPIKEKLTNWVNSFELPVTDVDNEVSNEIKKKFEAFKKWSITTIENQ